MAAAGVNIEKSPLLQNNTSGYVKAGGVLHPSGQFLSATYGKALPFSGNRIYNSIKSIISKRTKLMKAKHIPRIDIHNRMELKNALPLRTPYVIYIDPSDTCNFRCKFCPSGNLELMKKTRGRGHGPMDFDVYKGIIDSLQEFPDPIRVIRLYKEGEPLVNPRFADMVRYAKQSSKVLRVDTTTNASLLTPERSLEIIDAGLDRLNISVEGVNAEQYRDFSGHKMDYQKSSTTLPFSTTTKANAK